MGVIFRGHHVKLALVGKRAGEGERRNGSTKNGPEELAFGHYSERHEVSASGGDRLSDARYLDALRFRSMDIRSKMGVSEW